MTHCKEHLQVKIHELKGRRCDSMSHTTASTTRCFPSFYFGLIFGFSFQFCFVLVRESAWAESRSKDMRGQGEKWDRDT